jgi:hypothetical protein
MSQDLIDWTDVDKKLDEFKTSAAETIRLATEAKCGLLEYIPPIAPLSIQTRKNLPAVWRENLFRYLKERHTSLDQQIAQQQTEILKLRKEYRRVRLQHDLSVALDPTSWVLGVVNRFGDIFKHWLRRRKS